MKRLNWQRGIQSVLITLSVALLGLVGTFITSNIVQLDTWSTVFIGVMLLALGATPLVFVDALLRPKELQVYDPRDPRNLPAPWDTPTMIRPAVRPHDPTIDEQTGMPALWNTPTLPRHKQGDQRAQEVSRGVEGDRPPTRQS